MRRIFRVLTGSVRITFRSPRTQRLLDYTLRKNLPIWGIETWEGCLVFHVSPWDRKHLDEFFSHLGEEESFSWEKKGILRFFERYGKRWGFALGLGIFLSSLLFSTGLVWSVEVEGNVNIPEYEIRAQLAEMGLTPGVFISRIDPGRLSLQFQVEHSEFSFASLNVIGTRAIFSVREREEVKEEEKPYDGAANIVASISGQILRYEVLSGQVLVKRGQIVPKGTLLISGIIEKPNGAFETVTARGRVFAATQRYFEVTIPLEETALEYTGEEETKKAYEILGFTLASPTWNHTEYDTYEVVETVERVRFLGRDLPILCRERVYCETREKNKVLTVDRARKKAYDKYEEYKRDTFAIGYEIREENVQVLQDDNGVTLRVEISAVEDISRVLPFTCS